MAAPNVENTMRYGNILVALMLLGLGVLEIMQFQLTQIIVGGFVTFFGAAFFVLEFNTPDFIKTNCPFLFKNRGRGLVLIFLGALVFGDEGVQLYLSLFVIVVGVIYILVSFTNIPAPKPR